MVAMMTACNPGDRVVVFSPFYENYVADTILSGAEPIYVSLEPPTFRFREAELKKAFAQKPKAVILCNPNIHIATSWAYSRITPGAGGKPDNLRKVVTEGMRNPEILRQQLRNDFESVVFATYPEVYDLKKQMLDAGAEFVLMSGSGSTVFGLFEDVSTAERLAREFVGRGYRAFITPPHFGI